MAASVVLRFILDVGRSLIRLPAALAASAKADLLGVMLADEGEADARETYAAVAAAALPGEILPLEVGTLIRGGELGPASEAATNCDEASAASGCAARGLEASAFAGVVAGAAMGALVCTSKLGVRSGEVRRLGEAGTAAALLRAAADERASSSCPSCTGAVVMLIECCARV